MSAVGIRLIEFDFMIESPFRCFGSTCISQVQREFLELFRKFLSICQAFVRFFFEGVFGRLILSAGPTPGAIAARWLPGCLGWPTASAFSKI